MSNDIIQKTAAFTGHRPDKLGGYNENNPTAFAVKKGLEELITAAKSLGFTRFISGMALGVDTWAAEIVITDPEIKLIVAIPFKGQEKRWPKASRDRYHAILQHAAEVHILFEEPAIWTLHKRNEWMVDHSSLLLAVFDGSRDGGTAGCVKYAEKKSASIVIYNPRTGRME